jgi:hypothetical protein
VGVVNLNRNFSEPCRAHRRHKWTWRGMAH